MNLAPPAPLTEPAVAEPASKVEPAIATDAPFCEAAEATPPPLVEPAIASGQGEIAAAQYMKAIGMTTSISVMAVRQSGVDFESYAAVLQLDPMPRSNLLKVIFPCLLQNSRRTTAFGEVKKYILIKDGICLVYADKCDPSPIYAIPLDEMDVFPQDPAQPFESSVTVDPIPPKNRDNPNFATALLRHKHNEALVYQVSFDVRETGKDVIKRFIDVVKRAPRVLPALVESSQSILDK